MTYQKLTSMTHRPQPSLCRLFNPLSDSSTLETVIISGSPCPTLDQMLSPSPSGIVKLLPPSVSTLPMNAVTSINTLVNFGRSFPLSTGIKTLKVRSVEGDLLQLREDCQKRGIRLALA